MRETKGGYRHGMCLQETTGNQVSRRISLIDSDLVFNSDCRRDSRERGEVGGRGIGRLRTKAAWHCFFEKGFLKCVLMISWAEGAPGSAPRDTLMSQGSTSVLYSFSLHDHIHPCGFNFRAHTDSSKICMCVPHLDIPVISGMAVAVNMSIPSVPPVSEPNPDHGNILGIK